MLYEFVVTRNGYESRASFYGEDYNQAYARAVEWAGENGTVCYAGNCWSFE